MDRSDVRKFIIDWNLRFPVDYRWRKKFTIAFNSRDHRESNFIDQLIDIEEEEFFEELFSKEKYSPGTGNWLTPQKQGNIEDSIESFREEFKDIE